MILAAVEHTAWTPPRLVRRGVSTAVPIIVGYVVLWNVCYTYGQRTEYVQPLAFDELLAAQPGVACVINHDLSKQVAHTNDGSLELFTDSYGLVARVTPAGKWASHLIRQIRSGHLTRMSWKGRVLFGKATWRTDPIREIEKFKSLCDVCFCESGANPHTTFVVSDGR